MGGRDPSERLVVINWNDWSRSIGTPGRHQPVRAQAMARDLQQSFKYLGPRNFELPPDSPLWRLNDGQLFARLPAFFILSAQGAPPWRVDALRVFASAPSVTVSIIRPQEIGPKAWRLIR
jgi:hypothetical protein